MDQTADTSPGDFSELGEHLGSCLALQGRMFKLRCIFDVMHNFVAARFVTTLVAFAMLVGLSSWLL